MNLLQWFHTDTSTIVPQWHCCWNCSTVALLWLFRNNLFTFVQQWDYCSCSIVILIRLSLTGNIMIVLQWHCRIKKGIFARVHGWIYVYVWTYVYCVRRRSCLQGLLKQNITNAISFMNLPHWKLSKHFRKVYIVSSILFTFPFFNAFLHRIHDTIIVIIIIIVFVFFVIITFSSHYWGYLHML